MNSDDNLTQVLNIAKIIGKGYGNGWFTNNQCRYRVFKGARATKKSYVMIGVEVLTKIITCPLRNVMILRQVGGSNRLSTFATLQLLIHRPDVAHPEITLDSYFDINQSTMTIRYKPTGQLIVFDGLLNPTKITSTRMPRGFLTDIYVEEAFELKNYEDWRRVDGTVRGKLPKGYFFQITFCFNAWNKEHWLYEHFFKGRLEDDLEYLLTHDYQDWCDPNLIIDYGKGLYLHTSTYKINEFRDTEIYDLAMEQMREVAPEIYKVEALGMWGNASESSYPEMSDALIIERQEVFKHRYACYSIGIDTGLSDGEGRIKRGKDVKLRSATTMQLIGLTSDYSTLVCIDEFFYSNENEFIKKTEPQLQVEMIQKLKEWQDLYSKKHPDLFHKDCVVYVDCADRGFRDGLEVEARRQGLFGFVFTGSSKSVRVVDRVTFIRRIMAYGEFLISKACQNLIRELKSARKDEEKGLLREDINDHAINANEYAWIPIIGRLKRWGEYKRQG